jgi:hypothetical protein
MQQGDPIQTATLGALVDQGAFSERLGRHALCRDRQRGDVPVDRRRYYRDTGNYTTSLGLISPASGGGATLRTVLAGSSPTNSASAHPS